MSTPLKAALIAGTAALLASGAHGAVVTSWTFNNAATSPDLGNGETQAVETSIRTATISRNKASNRSAQPTNLALEVWDFDTDVARSGHDGLNFVTVTTDFEGLSVTFLQKNGARSSAWAQFQYSIDGGMTFVTTGLIDDGNYRVAGSKNFQLFNFDLSGIAQANNNANFQFRVMAVHAPDMDKFIATSGKRYEAAGAKATWKFDEVVVTGTTSTPVTTPAPGAMALLMAAGSLATGVRRRHH